VAGNGFIAGPKGDVYLVSKQGGLLRNAPDAGDVWNAVGSGDGRAYTPNVSIAAADPQNSQVFYAVDAQNHLIKSVDGGQKWITVSSGLPNAPILCLFVNAAAPQEVFAGTQAGLYKTADAGFSWQPIPSLTASVTQVYVNSYRPSVMYAVSAGTILVSSDAGKSWQKSETGLPLELVRGAGRTASRTPTRVSCLIFVNREKPFLLAATAANQVFRSDNNGTTWVSSSSGLDNTTSFTTAYIDKSYIVLASQNALYRSVDGMTWTKVLINSRMAPQYFTGVIRHPTRDGLLLRFRYAQDSDDNRRLGYLDPDGTLVGLTYGLTPHSTVDNVWTARSPTGRTLLFSTGGNYAGQSRPDTPFSSVSSDGGHSWELLSEGKPNCGERVAVRRGSAADIWVYGHGCVMRTQDGGEAWTMLPGFTLPDSSGSMSKLELDPQDPNLAYYCIGTNERHLFRYHYDPATRQGQSVDLKVLAPDVVVAEDNPKVLFTSSGQLSTDGGWTWIDKSKPLAALVDTNVKEGYVGPVRIVSLLKGELRAVVYRRAVSLGYEPGVTRIVKSNNLGDSWEQVTAFREALLQSSGFGGQGFGVYRNPHDSANFFIATFVNAKPPQTSRVRVLETRDRGETWREIYSSPHAQVGFPGEVREVVKTVVRVQNGSESSLWVGGLRGLWKSDDEGKTWKPVGGVQ